MQSLDRKATDKILQAGLDYLKQPGRKIATIGFSMGGQESLNANLNDPEAVNASVMISVKDGCGARRTELRGDRYGGKKQKMAQGEATGPKVYQSILDGWLPRNCQGGGKGLRLRP
jgi:dienelactone hydrolase